MNRQRAGGGNRDGRIVTRRANSTEPMVEVVRRRMPAERQGLLEGKLFQAAMQGRYGQAAECLVNGVKPDSRDTNDITPLMWACCNGHIGLAGLLLRYGADINATDMFGRTALDFAIGERHQGIIGLLESSGAMSGMTLMGQVL